MFYSVVICYFYNYEYSVLDKSWVFSLKDQNLLAEFPDLCPLNRTERVVILWMLENFSCLIFFFNVLIIPLLPVFRNETAKTLVLMMTLHSNQRSSWKYLTIIEANTFQLRLP